MELMTNETCDRLLEEFGLDVKELEKKIREKLAEDKVTYEEVLSKITNEIK